MTDRSRHAAWGFAAALPLAITGCLAGPGPFDPSRLPHVDATRTPTVATDAPVAGSALERDPCTLLDIDIIAAATGQVLAADGAPSSLPEASAEPLLGCRWSDRDAHEVSVLVDPSIRDVDAFYEAAAATAGEADHPLEVLDIEGASLAFGGDSDGYSAVAIVLDGIVHQVLYATPDENGRMAAAVSLAHEVAKAASRPAP